MAQALSIVEGVFGRACLLDKDRRVGPHAHPEPQVIIKIDGADYSYDVGETVAPCTRDRIVLVNALQLHGNHVVGKGRSVILSLYLSPQWLVEHHASLLAGGPLFHRSSERVPPRLRELADRAAAQMLQPAMTSPELMHPDTAGSRIQFLISEIVFAVFEQSAPPIAANRFSRLNDFRIRRAVAQMRDYLGGELDFADLASRVGLSRSRFFDLFSACTGLSPKHYMDMLRMDAAIEALARGDNSIAEIAARCGYSAQSHFTRFFTAQIGITPSEYRRASGRAGGA